MPNKNTYIALTIGPIYRTLEAAKRTRMLWGASYFFSYLIRELVKELSSKGIDFLIPSLNKIEEANSSNFGAGIYPDRFIFRSKEGDLTKVTKAIETIIDSTAGLMAIHLKDAPEFGELYTGYDKEQLQKDISTQLANYLQFYYVEREIEKGTPILKTLYQELDCLELYQKHILNIETNHLMNFLFRVSLFRPNSQKKSFLSEDAFGEGEKMNFSSLVEISTKGLRNDRNASQYDKNVSLFLEKYNLDLHKANSKSQAKSDDSENEFLNVLKKEFEGEFRNHHKYVAILYADGDGIGKLLEAIDTSDESLKTFSDKLIEFCKKVAQEIHDFGGLPVYLGGEDIFAFLPIVSKGSLFKVIQSLDKAFDALFDEFAPVKSGKIPKPTLSYGISINYYRSPHYENMKSARDLMYQAKNSSDEKNSISIRVEKHSGQFFNALIEKRHSKTYGLINKLIEESTQNNDIKKNRLFINSITHKLKDEIFWRLLYTVGSNKCRLAAFFENNFNEPIFKENPIKQYVADLQCLILTVFHEYLEEEKRKEILYFTLRFIDFINSKDER